MEPTALIVGGVVSFIVSVLSGVSIYRCNKQSDKMEEFATQITTLQNTAVSDSHVRRVVKEELLPLNISLQELVKSNQRIEVHIAEEKGFKAAQSLHLHKRRRVINKRYLK